MSLYKGRPLAGAAAPPSSPVESADGESVDIVGWLVSRWPILKPVNARAHARARRLKVPVWSHLTNRDGHGTNDFMVH